MRIQTTPPVPDPAGKKRQVRKQVRRKGNSGGGEGEEGKKDCVSKSLQTAKRENLKDHRGGKDPARKAAITSFLKRGRADASIFDRK